MSTLSLHEEKQIRIEAARMGAAMALASVGLLNDEISQREAYRCFGEAKVRTWVNTRLCTRVKIDERNSKVTYSRIELETIKRIEESRSK